MWSSCCVNPVDEVIYMKTFKVFFVILVALPFFVSSNVVAKKNKEEKASKQEVLNPRLKYMSAEDQELFNELTKKQQKLISQMKIEEGFNSKMVVWALGEPFYNTEHLIYPEYEQVWLYTKEDRKEKTTENKIMDPVNNWPSIHRVKNMESCTIGDFFVLFDRAVVDKIVKDTSGKRYGSCRFETVEEFLPIVDGKVKENPK